MAELSKNERDFFRVATYSSNIGMAIVGAVLGSLGGTGLDFSMRFSAGTILGGLGGWFFSWGLWWFFRRKAEKQAAQRKQSPAPRSAAT